MHAGFEFRLLGPLDVLHDGVPVQITAAKQWTLLACLLLNVNRDVPSETLIAQVWGEALPDNPRSALQSHIARLRRTLDRPSADATIHTRPEGYLLNEALDLRRGEPLADVPSDRLRHEVLAGLQEERLAAASLRVEAQLQLGAYQDAILELTALDHWLITSRENTSAPPLAALDVMLRALGIDVARIPDSTQQRAGLYCAGLYRRVVAERRMLIVLDNARDAAQVRTLLPGSPGCVTVVTSRSQLRGLVTREGAFRLAVDRLPAQAAAALFAGVGDSAGESNGDGKPLDTATIAELIGLCAGLPLAIRIIAERISRAGPSPSAGRSAPGRARPPPSWPSRPARLSPRNSVRPPGGTSLVARCTTRKG